MDSDQKILDELSAASHINMNPTKKMEIWNRIDAQMSETKPKKPRRKLTMFSNVAAVVAAIAVAVGGIGYITHSSFNTQYVPHPNSVTTATQSNGDILYNFADYKLRMNDKTIQFYEQGKIVNETIPYQATLTNAQIHSPWKTDPLQSAQVYTTNLLPIGFRNAAWTEKSQSQLSAKINGITVVYMLKNKKITLVPKTALVSVDIEGNGVHKSYNIYLFELGHRYVWNIYKITK